MTGPVSGVVLAAGLSTRFESACGENARVPGKNVAGATRPKQLYRIGGESLVRRTCREALASGLAEVILVTGYAERKVQEEVADLDLLLVHNLAYSDGQSGSVRCGLARVSDRAEGAMFLPVDQPALDAAIIDRLLGGFDGPDSIVVPSHRGRRGAPVTFGRSWFDHLNRLRGDEGARPLLQELAQHVIEVDLETELPLVDIDTEDEARSWAEKTAQ